MGNLAPTGRVAVEEIQRITSKRSTERLLVNEVIFVLLMGRTQSTGDLGGDNLSYFS